MAKTSTNPVVAAFVEAFTSHENSGSRIADICTAARAMFKGKPVPDAAAEEIANDVAAARGWEGDVAKVRRSECKRVLSVYAVLPEGISTVRKERGACQWTDALKLATKIKANGGDLAKGLAAYREAGGGATVSPKGRVIGALKAWYKADKKSRAKIRDAAHTLGITAIDFDALDGAK